MNRSDLWTGKEIEILDYLYPDPMNPVEDIAKQLGRTENAVRLKAARLGLKRDLLIPLDYLKAINNIKLAKASTNKQFIDHWLTEALEILEP